jgi:hypothetical protein
MKTQPLVAAFLAATDLVVSAGFAVVIVRFSRHEIKLRAVESKSELVGAIAPGVAKTAVLVLF